MKKLKKWCAAALAAVLTLSLITVPAGAADTIQDAYRAYYDFLQEEKDSVGKPYVGEYPGMSSYPFVKEKGGIWRNDELLFARLIDFDNNGIPELLFGKELGGDNPGGGYRPAVQVYDLYTYSGGQMVQAASANDLYISMAYYGAASPDGIEYSTSISYGTDGRVYMVNSGDTGGTDYENYSFTTLVNGKMTEVESLHIRFQPDIYISPDVMTSTGKLFYYKDYHIIAGGTEISRDAYYARRNALLGSGEQKIALKRSDIDATLNQLAQYVDAGYAARYRAPSDWAAESVNAAIAAGIVPATLQKKYASPITRAEFCALAANFYESSAGKTITQTASFNDTSDPAVQKMAGLGIVTGTGDGNFNPNGLLTREAAAAILVRLSAALGNSPAKSAPAFADNGSISGWAVESVGQCQAAGIMGSTGDNKFDPQGTYTREQSMVTLMRMGNTASQGAVSTLTIAEIPGVAVGLSKTLSVTSAPASVPNHALTWTSSNPAVATVDGNGAVTGVSEGTAVITATAAGGVSAQCPITVIGKSHAFFTAAPATIQCVNAWLREGTNYGRTDLDKSVENATPTAVITINSVEPQSTDVLLDRIWTATLHCTMETRDYGSSYFKWTAETAFGTIVCNGVANVPNKYKEGESFDLDITLYQLTPGESYTLRFYSYLP